MASCASVGVVSATAVPSASQLAVDPADVTNSATLVVATTVRASLRNGFADPALVKMMSGCRSSGIANAPAAPVASPNAARHSSLVRTSRHACRSSSVSVSNPVPPGAHELHRVAQHRPERLRVVRVRQCEPELGRVGLLLLGPLDHHPRPGGLLGHRLSELLAAVAGQRGL